MPALTLRLDDDQHEKLRLYRALTGRAVNDLVAGLVREFFECQGDAEIAEALTERARRQHGRALAERGEGSLCPCRRGSPGSPRRVRPGAR